jgi:hypothetical protein
MNESKPLIIKCRNRRNVIETRGLLYAWDAVWGIPVYCPDGDRHKGGMTVVRARGWNVGPCDADVKGEGQGEELTRPRVPMRHRGADRLIVAMNPGNAGGAKGTNDSASVMDQPAMGGVRV